MGQTALGVGDLTLKASAQDKSLPPNDLMIWAEAYVAK